MININTRIAEPGDAEHIKQLALDNNMFEPEEMGDFDEMLAGFFAGDLEGHQWLVAIGEDTPNEMAAAAYYAPEPFSDRVWNLYFLAAQPGQHRAGAGTALVERVETDLRALGEESARTLIVDTSSLDEYDQARQFYEKRGFVEEARIRDFYGDGDDKVTFWKSLVS